MYTRTLAVLLSVASMSFAPTPALAANFSVNSMGTALIGLNNGDDKLLLSSGDMPGTLHYRHNGKSGSLTNVKSLVVNGQGGKNAISLSGFTIERDVTIRSSGKRDIISVLSGNIGRRLAVVSGNGVDALKLSGVVVKGTSTINTSGGNDSIEIHNLTVGRTLQILTGNGNDNVLISVGRNDNAMSLMGRAHINTSNGDDTVLLDSTMIAGRMAFVTGSGQDSITLTNNFMDTLVVNTGAQDDLLTATGNTVAGRSQLNGTTGNADIYRQDETNVYGAPYVFSGFEIEELVTPF